MATIGNRVALGWDRYDIFCLGLGLHNHTVFGNFLGFYFNIYLGRKF